MREMISLFTAAQIMTPRADWVTWKRDGPRHHVLDEDRRLRFDVIPVVEDDKVVGLITDPSFVVRPLTLEWCLTYDVPIERLIAFFIEREKPACFLLSGDGFAGLVTPADLNKAGARTAFYLRLAELEMQLAVFIRSHGISEAEVLNELSEDHRKEIERKQIELAEKDVDVSVFEMLYLSDMLNIIAKSNPLRGKLGFSSRSAFERATSGLNDLRNRVMHPARPVLQDTRDDLHTLYERITRMARLEECLAEREDKGRAKVYRRGVLFAEEAE